jgi:hypothetical protein
VKTLRLLDEMVGTAAIIDGRAALDLALGGTPGAPSGTLRLLDEMVGTAAIIDGRAALDLALGGMPGAPSGRLEQGQCPHR